MSHGVYLLTSATTLVTVPSGVCCLSYSRSSGIEACCLLLSCLLTTKLQCELCLLRNVSCPPPCPGSLALGSYLVQAPGRVEKGLR